MTRQTFTVTGMTCSACSAHVERAVKALNSATNVSVNLLTNTLKLEYDENVLTPEMIIAAVKSAGYGVEEADNQKATKTTEKSTISQQRKKEAAAMSKRFFVSLVFLVPLMFVSMGGMLVKSGFLYDNLFSSQQLIFKALICIILLAPILIINKHYFVSGFKALISGRANMDTLVALGSTVSVIYSLVVTLVAAHSIGSDNFALDRYSHSLYFESSGMILTLITLGKMLEARAKGQTSRAIEKMMSLAPDTAIVERDGGELQIESSELECGDVFILKPGMKAPADGTIIFGSASIDESSVTGESIPTEKSQGDAVTSATTVYNGYIKVRATRVGENTTLSEIVRLMEEASASKAPIAKLADKISGIFVPCVIAIAVITVIIWLALGFDLGKALSFGTAVLVISCPCALGLATPVAIMVGTGKGAQSGILIKSGEALQTAHSVSTVVLDKTGTITEGKPKITDVLPLKCDTDELLIKAYSLEKLSAHPLAGAVCEYCEEKLVAALQATDYNEESGKGVSANINGEKIYSGNLAYISEIINDTSACKSICEQLSADGKTPLIFCNEQAVLGIIAAKDNEKPSSAYAIGLIEGMGVDVVMMTGDNERTASAIAKKVGIKTYFSSVKPKDKQNKLAELSKNKKRTAMVGDGINDAPALISADVGIAIGAGTDIAIESADIVLVKNDLVDVANAVKLSRAVIKNIKENLFWAFFYNSVGIPIAAGVLYIPFGISLSPMLCAAAMSLSSFCVVMNALRLKNFVPFSFDGNKSENINIEKGEQKEMKYTVTINGMMCQKCEQHATAALEAIGAKNLTVSHTEGKAEFTGCRISEEKIRTAITNAGYEVVEVIKG